MCAAPASARSMLLVSMNLIEKKHIVTSKGSPILIMKKRETKLNLKHFFFVKLFPTKFMDGSYRLVVAKDKA
jgi:hypothetical protein